MGLFFFYFFGVITKHIKMLTHPSLTILKNIGIDELTEKVSHPVPCIISSSSLTFRNVSDEMTNGISF